MMSTSLRTIKVAMWQLNVSRVTIYRMVNRGELEMVRTGMATRITGASIDRLIEVYAPLAEPRPSLASAQLSTTGEVMTDQKLYKVSTAMEMLDVCRATIYRMGARGELEIVKIGQRATRVTAQSIERAIAAGKAKS